MKVLVLGGTGNISSCIIPLLIDKGHCVTVYNRGQRDIKLPDGIDVLTGDRSDRDSFAQCMADQDFDTVIDMICYTREDAASTLEVFGDRIQQVIFTSTVACYKRPVRSLPPFKEEEIEYCDDPAHGYGYKKALMEKYIIDNAPGYKDLSWSIVRPALTYGRAGYNFGVFRQNYGLVKRIKSGKPLVVFGDGQVPMTFSFSPDVAAGYVAMVGNKSTNGQIYHLNTMAHTTWNELYTTLGKVAGREPEIIHISTDLLYNSAPGQNAHIFHEKQYLNLFDSSKASRDLGFRTEYTLESGIKWLLDWWETGHVPPEDPRIEKYEDDLVSLYRKWEQESKDLL